jgi:hypothetical protein
MMGWGIGFGEQALDYGKFPVIGLAVLPLAGLFYWAGNKINPSPL